MMKKIKEIKIFVDFVKKNIECDKVRDNCHLTGKYRGPAHSIWYIPKTNED